MEKLDFTPENLKIARARARLTQQELADESDVSRDTIARYETGKNPNASRRTMIKIASVLREYNIRLIHPWSDDFFDSDDVRAVMVQLAHLDMQADEVSNLDAMAILVSAITLYLNVNKIDQKIAPTIGIKIANMARIYRASPEIFDRINQVNDISGFEDAIDAIIEYAENEKESS